MPAPALLIADDQPDIRAALHLLCKGHGYDVDSAGSPTDILRAVERRRYDAVLIDMNYTRDTTSGAEGLDLLTALRTYDALTPIIVMTAWSTVGLAVDAMRRGAVDFIQKPWDNDVVIATLRAQVDRHRAARHAQAAAEWHDADMARAALVQQHLLDSPSSPHTPLDCAVRSLPARGVGGDFHHVVALDANRTLFLVGDVTGKGIAAALLMAHLQAHVRMVVAQPDVTPGLVLGALNTLLHGIDVEEHLATACCAIDDRATGTLSYATAGHPPPICTRSNGCTERLTTEGPILGLFPTATFTTSDTPFRHGDRLVMFTDGVTDGTNDLGEHFSDDRLVTLVQDSPTGIDATLHGVLTAHHAFTGDGQPADDLTLLVAGPGQREHRADAAA